MRARARLPLGRMVLDTPDPVSGMEARLDLWNAEVSGRLVTARGPIQFRSYVHAEQPVLVVELTPPPGQAGDRGGTRFFYEPDIPINDRLLTRKQEVIAPGDFNPAPFVQERGALRLAVQRRTGGGEHVVAWQEKAMGGRRLLVVSVATSVADSSARQTGRRRRRAAPWPAARSSCAEPPRVLERLLPAELPLAARHPAGELLLDPDVQAGLGHPRRPARHRHPGPLVPPHALAGHLVEPQHPAQLLAGVHGQPPVAGRIAAGPGRPQPGQPAQQRARGDARRLHGRGPGQRTRRRVARADHDDRDGPARAVEPDLDHAQLLAALPAHHGPGDAARAPVPGAEGQRELSAAPAGHRQGRPAAPARGDLARVPQDGARHQLRSRPAALGAADPAEHRPAPGAGATRWPRRWQRHPGPPGALPGGRHRLPHRARPAAGGLAPALLPPADGLPAAPGHRPAPRGARR